MVNQVNNVPLTSMSENTAEEEGYAELAAEYQAVDDERRRMARRRVGESDK